MMNVFGLYPGRDCLQAVISSIQMNFYLKNPFPYGICLSCGHVPERINSHDWSTLIDTPIGERADLLHLRCRKFFCPVPSLFL